MTKKKVRVFTDKKGQYILNTEGKKLRIKSKDPLTERELVKFLVTYLKPKRRNRKGKVDKEVKHKNNTDGAMATSLSTLNDKISSLAQQEFARKYQGTKPAQIEDKKEPVNLITYRDAIEDYDKMTKREKTEYLTHHPKFGDIIKEWGEFVTNDKINSQKQIQDKSAENRLLKKQKLDVDMKNLITLKNKEFENEKLKEYNKKRMEAIYKANKNNDVFIKVNARPTDEDYKNNLLRNITMDNKPLIRSENIIREDIDKKYSEITKKLRDEIAEVTDNNNEENKGEIEGAGKRNIMNNGQSDSELNRIMIKYQEYLGTIAHNEIETKILPRIKARSRICFVINTDSASKAGEHWQAVFADARPGGSNSIEFYDSYADSIDKVVMRGIKHIVEKLDAPTYLKFKENKIRAQNGRSSNCGFFATKFLIDRLRGKPFADASGYNESAILEPNIEKWKHTLHIQPFSYLSSSKAKFGKGDDEPVKEITPEDEVIATVNRQKQEADDAINAARNTVESVKKSQETKPSVIGNLFNTVKNGISKAHEIANSVSTIGNTIASAKKVFDYVVDIRQIAPPSIRTYLQKYGNLDIHEVTVVRKPLSGIIKTLANWASRGKLDENRKSLGYDDIYHLFMAFKLADGQVIRMDKDEVVKIAHLKHLNGEQVLRLAVPSNLTLNLMFERAQKAVGENRLWVYDPRNNNCQRFVKDMLVNSSMWNSELETFVMQDAQGLLKGMENLGESAKSVTDLASRINVVLNGKGRKKKRRVVQ